jgi:hypothetical protein
MNMFYKVPRPSASSVSGFLSECPFIPDEEAGANRYFSDQTSIQNHQG